MTRDKTTDVLIAALKQALAEPGEHRLYRSGKLAGLFASRSGVNGDAAAQALRDDLLESIRTESKGKTQIEWVRLTPRGVDFIHAHESPVHALRDLQAEIQATKENVPAWLEGVQRELAALGTRLADEVQRALQRLDALGRQAEEVLQRLAASAPGLPEDLENAVPWGTDALAYLDRRRSGGATGDCSLPELFAALREGHDDLSVTAFHDGLRRLAERRIVRLRPLASPDSELPEPEYALLDGSAVYYFISR